MSFLANRRLLLLAGFWLPLSCMQMSLMSGCAYARKLKLALLAEMPESGSEQGSDDRVDDHVDDHVGDHVNETDCHAPPAAAGAGDGARMLDAHGESPESEEGLERRKKWAEASKRRYEKEKKNPESVEKRRENQRRRFEEKKKNPQGLEKRTEDLRRRYEEKKKDPKFLEQRNENQKRRYHEKKKAKDPEYEKKVYAKRKKDPELLKKIADDNAVGKVDINNEVHKPDSARAESNKVGNHKADKAESRSVILGPDDLQGNNLKRLERAVDGNSPAQKQNSRSEVAAEFEVGQPQDDKVDKKEAAEVDDNEADKVDHADQPENEKMTENKKIAENKKENTLSLRLFKTAKVERLPAAAEEHVNPFVVYDHVEDHVDDHVNESDCHAPPAAAGAGDGARIPDAPGESPESEEEGLARRERAEGNKRRAENQKAGGYGRNQKDEDWLHELADYLKSRYGNEKDMKNQEFVEKKRENRRRRYKKESEDAEALKKRKDYQQTWREEKLNKNPDYYRDKMREYNYYNVKKTKVLLQGKSNEADKVDENEADKVVNNEADKVDKKEAAEVDDNEADKVDKNEADKVDKKEAAEVDKNEADKVVNNGADKVVNNEAGKVDKNEADKVVNNEADKVDKNEADKVVNNEADKVGKNEADKVDHADQPENEKMTENKKIAENKKENTVSLRLFKTAKVERLPAAAEEHVNPFVVDDRGDDHVKKTTRKQAEYKKNNKTQNMAEYQKMWYEEKKKEDPNYFKTDPEALEKKKAYQKTWREEKLKKNPDYYRDKLKKWYEEKKKEETDPEALEKKKAYQKKWREEKLKKNPDYYRDKLREYTRDKLKEYNVKNPVSLRLFETAKVERLPAAAEEHVNPFVVDDHGDDHVKKTTRKKKNNKKTQNLAEYLKNWYKEKKEEPGFARARYQREKKILSENLERKQRKREFQKKWYEEKKKEDPNYFKKNNVKKTQVQVKNNEADKVVNNEAGKVDKNEADNVDKKEADKVDNAKAKSNEVVTDNVGADKSKSEECDANQRSPPHMIEVATEFDVGQEVEYWSSTYNKWVREKNNQPVRVLQKREK
jgi:hypothetical protein